MKKTENNENVFDEIDRDIDQFKIAIKVSRHERMLNTQRKMLRGLIVLVFILSTISIYFGIFKGHKINISIGIMSLFLAIYGLVFLKLISKSKTKKGDKR